MCEGQAGLPRHLGCCLPGLVWRPLHRGSLLWARLAFSAAASRERRLCVGACSGQEQRSALTLALADLRSPVV